MFWPEEDSYSEVPESKVVGEPGEIGEDISVKEGTKVYRGLLHAVGSRQEVQLKLQEIKSGGFCDESSKLQYFMS